jgi:hypothetical protein
MSTTTEPTGRLKSDLAAAVRTADRIDYWIRRHVIQYCYGTHPSRSKLNPARDRSVSLSAIGQCLKDQYDAIAAPISPRLAALVKQLETQEGMDHATPQRAVLSV